MTSDTLLQHAEEKAFQDQISKLDDIEFLAFLDEMYNNVRIPSLRATLKATIARLTR